MSITLGSRNEKCKSQPCPPEGHAAPGAAAGAAGGAGLWAGCAGQAGGLGAESAGAGTSAPRTPAPARLADVLCAARGAASRALPGVWPAIDPDGVGGPATPAPPQWEAAAGDTTRPGARVAGGRMTLCAGFAQVRPRSSSVRRGACARSPCGAARSSALLPARSASPRPSASSPPRLRPLRRPQVALAVAVESP